MSTDQKILDSINTAVEERTLSLEAVEAIQQLRKDHESLQEKFEITDRDHKAARVEVTRTTTALGNAETTLKAWEGKEEDLLAREKACMKMEVENEHLKIRIADHKELNLSLTRNLQFRKEVVDSVNGYGDNGNINENRTTTVTKNTE